VPWHVWELQVPWHRRGGAGEAKADGGAVGAPSLRPSGQMREMGELTQNQQAKDKVASG